MPAGRPRRANRSFQVSCRVASRAKADGKTGSSARLPAIAPARPLSLVTSGPWPSVFGQFSVLSQRDTTSSIYRALEHWVESGVAPGEIHAVKMTEDGKGVAMTRPICPYPQLPKYKGSGNTNAVQSFTCAAN